MSARCAASRAERGILYLSSLLVNTVDHVDGVEVVDSGVETDLVEDSDTGVNSLLVESLHSVRNVRSRDDVLLELDGRLDDVGVLSVRNERDDKVVLLDGSVERGLVGGIDSEGRRRAREGSSELLGGRKGSAS